MQGERFTLGILPVPALAHTHKLVSRILKKVRDLVEIEAVVVDKGFYSTETILVIMNMGIIYEMPAPRHTAVKKRIEANQGYRFAIEDYQVGGQKKEWTKLVIAPSPRKDREIVEKDKEFVYITKGPVDEETIPHEIEQYDSRWGIVTGFRVRNGFKIRTNTENMALRYRFFFMTAMLYYFWLVANVLKGWKPNPHYDYAILARDFRWALECLITFYMRPDG